MTWPERFLKLFQTIERPLGSILNAKSCRESWLQGEFYLHFRGPESGFRVNCLLNNTRALYDIVCALPKMMVAELKVYGLRNYDATSLCGHSNISRFVPAANASRNFWSQEDIEQTRTKKGDLSRRCSPATATAAGI